MSNQLTARRECGCPDDRRTAITRRNLFKALGVMGAAGAVSPLLSTQVALAAPDYTGDTLVVLSMRGGFDGLSAVVPYGDPDYTKWRPGIGVPSNLLLAKDSMFGLHPSFQPLLPYWNAGTFGVVQACGLWAPDRSHFEATAEMERAAPGSSVRSGWLDRVIGVNGLTGSSFQAVQVGGTLPPDSLLGPNPELAMDSLDGFRLSGGDSDAGRQKWDKALRALHSISPTALKQPTTTTLNAIQTVADLGTADDYAPGNGAVYDSDSGFASALRDVARMIKGGVGLQVVCVDYGDWDMHAGLQPIRTGTSGDFWFADHLLEFTSAIAAFMQDLGAKMDDVTVVTLTEFGRRVEENDSAGVDHGYATSVMLAGNGVKGGSVKMTGAWPTLSEEALVDGDLAVTTDYRTVLREILAQRCGVSSNDLASIFPGAPTGSLDIVRAKT